MTDNTKRTNPLKRDLKANNELTFTSQPDKHLSSDSRFLIKILKAENLLASDAETGKSDPICFVWCGLPNEVPTLDKTEPRKDLEKTITKNEDVDKSNNGNNIQRTKVLKERIDPIWNEEKTFFLDFIICTFFSIYF